MYGRYVSCCVLNKSAMLMIASAISNTRLF